MRTLWILSVFTLLLLAEGKAGESDKTSHQHTHGKSAPPAVCQLTLTGDQRCLPGAVMGEGVITQVPSLVHGTEGQSVTLNCTVRNTNVGAVRWSRDTGRGRQPFFNTGGGASDPRVSFILKNHLTDRSIRIDNLTLGDSGVYYCDKYRPGPSSEIAVPGPGMNLTVTASKTKTTLPLQFKMKLPFLKVLDVEKFHISHTFRDRVTEQVEKAYKKKYDSKFHRSKVTETKLDEEFIVVNMELVFHQSPAPGLDDFVETLKKALLDFTVLLPIDLNSITVPGILPGTTLSLQFNMNLSTNKGLDDVGSKVSETFKAGLTEQVNNVYKEKYLTTFLQSEVEKIEVGEEFIVVNMELVFHQSSAPGSDDLIKTLEKALLDFTILLPIDLNSITVPATPTPPATPAPTTPPSHCHGHSKPWPLCTEGPSASGRGILGESLTEFALHFYKEARRIEDKGNMLISPVSVAELLTLLLLGARGDTQTTLENVLSLPQNFTCVHEEVLSLTKHLRGSVEMASRIYYKPGLKLTDFFGDQSQQFYGAKPQQLTNNGTTNLQMINDWVAQKTHNQIKHLVDSVPQNTEFMLLNAIYYIGKWKIRFNENETDEEDFTTLEGKHVRVPVMKSKNYRLAIQYSAELKAKVARFLLSGDVSLYVFLPPVLSTSALKEVEDRLNLETLTKLVKTMERMEPQEATVALPRLKLDSRTDLLHLMESLGLRVLFDSPNLCGLVEEDILALSDARHQARISLNEVGVEAAGASSVSLARSFSSFSALHPFITLLWSDQARAPLFIGRVADPSQS
ncbi:plasma protease C1 inhibitor isoform X2 [Lepisosteus oculatus]|uniref:plasma protease C1 inhibitor isoform X2 n=1 Tax=Lepisosteus oculatus TaxID=7918 RepID=UPI00371515A6